MRTPEITGGENTHPETGFRGLLGVRDLPQLHSYPCILSATHSKPVFTHPVCLSFIYAVLLVVVINHFISNHVYSECLLITA